MVDIEDGYYVLYADYEAEQNRAIVAEGLLREAIPIIGDAPCPDCSSTISAFSGDPRKKLLAKIRSFLSAEA